MFENLAHDLHAFLAICPFFYEIVVAVAELTGPGTIEGRRLFQEMDVALYIDRENRLIIIPRKHLRLYSKNESVGDDRAGAEYARSTQIE